MFMCFESHKVGIFVFDGAKEDNVPDARLKKESLNKMIIMKLIVMTMKLTHGRDRFLLSW